MLEYRTEMDFNVDIVKELLEPEIKRNMKYDLFSNNNQTINLESEDDTTLAEVNKLDQVEFKKNSLTLTNIKKNFQVK